MCWGDVQLMKMQMELNIYIFLKDKLTPEVELIYVMSDRSNLKSFRDSRFTARTRSCCSFQDLFWKETRVHEQTRCTLFILVLQSNQVKRSRR